MNATYFTKKASSPNRRFLFAFSCLAAAPAWLAQESGLLSAAEVTPEEKSYYAHVAAAAGALETGDVAGALHWLKNAPEGPRNFEWRYLEQACDDSLVEVRTSDTGLQCLAWSINDKWLAAGGNDGVVRLLDPVQRVVTRELKAHDREVLGIAFSPDGSLLATSGGDAKAKVFDASTFSTVSVFEKHTFPIGSVAFSPDGELVASCSYDPASGGEVRVWKAADGSEVRRFQTGYAPITCVDWSPDGREIHAGSWAGLYARWAFSPAASNGGAASNADRAIAVGSEDDYRAVNALAISRDGTLAALGGKDDLVHVFNAESGEKRFQLAGHERPVWGLAFSPDGTLLASSAQDGGICTFDTYAGRLIRRLNGHRASVRGLAFSPEGLTLASASLDGAVRFWDVATARVPSNGTLVGTKGDTSAYYACESPDGALTAVGLHDGRVLVISNETQAVVSVLSNTGWVNWVDFSPDGERVLAAGEVGIAIFSPIRSHRELAIEGIKNVECAVFSPDGLRVAAGSRDKTARIFGSILGEEQLNLPHDGIVREVHFSPDGKRLLTSSARSKVAAVFDAATGERLLELGPHEGTVDSIGFHPSGEIIATSADDGALRLWNAADGSLLDTVICHDGEVLALAFSPDGTRIATGGSDYRIVLTDVRTRRVALLVEDTEMIYAVRFSADGERLLTVPLTNRFRVLHTRPLRERLAAAVHSFGKR